MAHKRRGLILCHSLAIPAGNRDNAAQPIFAAAMLAAQTGICGGMVLVESAIGS